MIEDLTQGDRTAMLPRGDQWSQGLGKIKWVDLFEREVAVLKCVKNFCVCPVAGAERLDRVSLATALPQVRQKQRGEDRFPDASVSSVDEDDSGLHGLKLRSFSEFGKVNGQNWHWC